MQVFSTLFLNNFVMEFNQVLKHLREEMSMSQEDLAKMFNTTNQTISRWELGQNEPDIKTLRAIAQYFKVTVGQLVGAEMLY